jgi:hypothetical protein
MVNWFEWDKHEVEVGGPVDWRAAGNPRTAEAFTADLPEWYLFAGEREPCAADG